LEDKQRFNPVPDEGRIVAVRVDGDPDVARDICSIRSRRGCVGAATVVGLDGTIASVLAFETKARVVRQGD